MISAAFPYDKQRMRVLGREMAYVEAGVGDPIVPLRGIPTSSYLWRNVIPHLQSLDSGLAPDLRPGEDRRPTLTWPRQIPVEGEPADVTGIVNSYSDWLRRSDVPKLFINGEPGASLTGPSRDFCRTWPAQRHVTVRGRHFLQEDSPDEIGRAISDWVPTTCEAAAL